MLSNYSNANKNLLQNLFQDNYILYENFMYDLIHFIENREENWDEE